MTPRQSQRVPEAILVVYQSGKRTCGSVIRADERGTLILTCRHGRREGDPWRAGGLSGNKTIVDQHADLALLFTRQRWYGRPLTISKVPPLAPLRWTVSPRGDCGLFVEVASTRWTIGDSGMPLMVEGAVAGILNGNNEIRDQFGRLIRRGDRAFYVQQHEVTRFLEGAGL